MNETENATSTTTTTTPSPLFEEIVKLRRKRSIRIKREIQKVCDPQIVFGAEITAANSFTFEVDVKICNCGNASEDLKNNMHIPGNISKENYYPGDLYNYFAITETPWDSSLESDRTPPYKIWKKALMNEVPLLIASSSIASEVKPEVHFLGFVMDSGFISGHFNITFRRPHWDNPDRFISAMHEVSSRYELDNETEGVFGNTFSGFEKHKFRGHKLTLLELDYGLEEEAEAEPLVEEAEEERELTKEEQEEEIKKLRSEDNPARLAALPVACLILVSVLSYMMCKSRACMIKTWC